MGTGSAGYAVVYSWSLAIERNQRTVDMASGTARIGGRTNCECVHGRQKVLIGSWSEIQEIQEEEDKEREAVVGMTSAWRILFVVYVALPTAFRLISAREVIKAESQN